MSAQQSAAGLRAGACAADSIQLPLIVYQLVKG
jgi:hypothetical protein